MIDYIGIIQGGGQMQRIDIGVDVLSAFSFALQVFDVEVQVQHLDVVLLKELIDVRHGFLPVDKPDFHTLEGVDGKETLQENQNTEDQNAANQTHPVITVAGGQSETGRVPYGSGRGETADLPVVHEDGAGTEKTDAADDLGGHTAEVVGDVRAGLFIHIVHEQAFNQGNHTGAETDQDVGAQACRPVFVFAFRADQAADENGNKDTEEQLHRGKGIGADQTKKHPITPF